MLFFSPTHIVFFTKRFIAHHIQDNFHYNLQIVQKIPELLSLTPAVSYLPFLSHSHMYVLKYPTNGKSENQNTSQFLHSRPLQHIHNEFN